MEEKEKSMGIIDTIFGDYENISNWSNVNKETSKTTGLGPCRFALNDSLKKYIREVEETRDKTEIVRDYLRELEYDCNISFNFGNDHVELHNYLVLPDWEKQCFRFDKKKRDTKFDILNEIFDLKNTFNIPFKMVLDGHVRFVTTHYGNIDITYKYIDLIKSAYSNSLSGYKYEFIPEVWKDAHHYGKIFYINHVFYTVYFCQDMKTLTLCRCDNGQAHSVTVLELLRGKYNYTDELEKDENGLIIPSLSIQSYEIKED